MLYYWLTLKKAAPGNHACVVRRNVGSGQEYKVKQPQKRIL